MYCEMILDEVIVIGDKRKLSLEKITTHLGQAVSRVCFNLWKKRNRVPNNNNWTWIVRDAPFYQSCSFCNSFWTLVWPPPCEHLVENFRPLRGHLLGYYDFCNSFCNGFDPTPPLNNVKKSARLVERGTPYHEFPVPSFYIHALTFHFHLVSAPKWTTNRKQGNLQQIFIRHTWLISVGHLLQFVDV